MPFQPGNRANPNGRPPKQRALTAILEAELSKTVNVGEDRRVAGKRQVAALITQFLTTGSVTFPDGRTLMAKSLDEYFTVARWLYRHIDGEKTHLDITTLGESFIQRVEVVAPGDEPTSSD